MEFSIIDDEKLEHEVWQEVNLIGMPKKSKSPVANVSKMLIELSDMCQWYLTGTRHDPEEITRIDGVWKMVDASLRDFDLSNIEKIRKEIGPMLRSQREVLRDRYVEKAKQRFKS